MTHQSNAILSAEIEPLIENIVERLPIVFDPETHDLENHEGTMPSEPEAIKYFRHLLMESFSIHTVVGYYVNVSTDLTDIAKTFNVIPDTIRQWMNTSDWKLSVKYWELMRELQSKKSQDKERVPFPLREDYLLTSAFQKDSDVRLVTYDGFIDARVKDVLKYDHVLADDRKVKKHDVILAFPKDRMPYVKKGIKRRKSVADMGLRPIQKASDSPKIDVVARLGSLVECVMRNGLVVVGENVWISKYNIVMRVGGRKGYGGKIILVYKHALHDFQVLKQPSKYQRKYHDGWDEEDE